MIIFLLPTARTTPCGGHKVIYKYANYFAEKGYEVIILYAAYSQIAHKRDLLHLLRHAVYMCYLWSNYIIRKIIGRSQKNSWYHLHASVREIECFRYTPFIKRLSRRIRNSIFVSTALRTAYDLANANVAKNRCYYFVQDFEAWGVPDEVVYNSYKLPLQKITISTWLKDCINSMGEDAILIPNGFDFSYFEKTNSIIKRNNSEVAMLYHTSNRKGCIDAISALEKVKAEIPDLHVNMFGVCPRPSWLPSWFSYYCNPDRQLHNSIYNNSAIYVAASKVEGFGLTVGEAMICGCAIVCTDAGGFKMMVQDGITGLMSKVGDVNSLADNILLLIRNSELRIKLATAGNKYIYNYRWERSFKKMEDTLCMSISK